MDLLSSPIHLPIWTSTRNVAPIEIGFVQPFQPWKRSLILGSLNRLLLRKPICGWKVSYSSSEKQGWTRLLGPAKLRHYIYGFVKQWVSKDKCRITHIDKICHTMFRTVILKFDNHDAMIWMWKIPCHSFDIALWRFWPYHKHIISPFQWFRYWTGHPHGLLHEANTDVENHGNILGLRLGPLFWGSSGRRLKFEDHRKWVCHIGNHHEVPHVKNCFMWVKQCHFYQPWLGMLTIAPIKMLLANGLWHCFTHINTFHVNCWILKMQRCKSDEVWLTKRRIHLCQWNSKGTMCFNSQKQGVLFCKLPLEFIPSPSPLMRVGRIL